MVDWDSYSNSFRVAKLYILIMDIEEVLRRLFIRTHVRHEQWSPVVSVVHFVINA